MGNTNEETGVWLEELAVPYYIFKDAEADIILASPAGGPVPLDPQSQAIILATFTTKRFIKDEEAMNFLSASVVLEEINASDFDVIFLPGGRGAMWDLADNKKLKQLLESFNRENKPIGALSHGVSALLLLQNDDGTYWVKDRQLTGFSNSEEESFGAFKQIPFSLETRLRSLGAIYSQGENYCSHVVKDTNIITGQNAASSREAAQNVLALLRYTHLLITCQN